MRVGRLFQSALLVALLSGGAVSCQNNASAASPAGQEQSEVVNVNLNAKDFAALLDTASTGVVLDVRTPGEYSEGHIEKAQLLDIYQRDAFNAGLEKLDRDVPVYVYCRSGARSGNAAQMMKQMGFKKVYNLQGGIISWSRSGQKIVQ